MYNNFEDSESEGFDSDSDSDSDVEGFDNDDSDSEGFDSDDSDVEGFKAKSKASKAFAKSNKAISKSAKKTGKAIKNSKTGKAFSKAAKAIKNSKTGKAFSKAAKKAGKKAKKFKQNIIDPALTRAQIQARNAQLQMQENNIALGNAQKHMAQMKSSISKQVQDVDVKEFNKIPVPNKSSSLVFLGFSLIIVAIVFGLYFLKYSNSHIADLIDDMNKLPDDKTPPKSGNSMLMNAGLIIVILAIITFFSVIFKGLVLKTDITKKHVLNIATSVLTVGLPILAITLLTVNNLPLMMRSFENTFGFSWINGDKLKELTQKLFGGNNNYNDYTIIATQLFEENFKYYLSCMKKGSAVDPNINLNRFKNVFIDDSYFDENGKIKIKVPNPDKPDEKVQDLFDLFTMVTRKRHISVAIWTSLATVGTMYISYLFL